MKRALGSIFNVLKQDKFIKSTVRKILFGLDNPLIKLGNDVLPEDKKYPFPLFGLFVGRNATDRGTTEVKTGLKNRDELGKIVKIDKKSKLKWWFGDKCNEVK